MLSCCFSPSLNIEETAKPREQMMASKVLSLGLSSDEPPATVNQETETKRVPSESPRKVAQNSSKRKAESPRKTTKTGRCPLRNCGLKHCDVMDTHPYQCCFCELVFLTPQQRKLHEFEAHSGQEPPKKEVTRRERREANKVQRNAKREEEKARLAKLVHPPEVFIRVRPLNAEEEKSSYLLPGLKTKTELAQDLGSGEKVAMLEEGVLTGFEGVLGMDSSNTEVYSAMLANKIDMILRGGQVSMFCYGHTGTGKTHTSMGHGSHPGLFKLACKDILKALEEINSKRPEDQKLFVQVRFTEVHLRKVYDLLMDPKAECLTREDENGEFRIRRRAEKTGKGWYVAGDQKYVVVKDIDALLEMLEKGIKTRACGSSSVHDESSRSHAMMEMEIVTEELAAVREQANEQDSELGYGKLQCDKKDPEWPRRKVEKLKKKLAKTQKRLRTILENDLETAAKTGVAVGGTLTLADLAGADYDHRTYTESGNGKQEQRESAEINKELFNIKECMRHNVARKPWRESVLAKILKKVLQPRGGREAQALMVATVSPAESQERHTLSTLRYAQMVSGHEDDKALSAKASRDRDMKRQIRAVYREYCPEKSPDEVEAILSKWSTKGKLNRLLALVWAKYTKEAKAAETQPAKTNAAKAIAVSA